MNTYIISGGGTGGHIFPALAIAGSIQTLDPEARVLFVGTRYGLEKEIVPKFGYPLLTLPIRGLLGKSIFQKLALFWRFPLSILLSIYFLIRYRPKVVLGVGGYASLPMVLTAAAFFFPTLIHEANAFPGLSNRILARFVKIVCVGFKETVLRLKGQSIVTGNPVRAEFSSVNSWSPENKTILVLGGSQGASDLNRDLPKMFKKMDDSLGFFRVLHQCGHRWLDQVRNAYEGAPFEAEVVPFIDDLPQVMSQTYLVICRSGAITVSELRTAKIPAVLIPFPNATHDHQTFNARTLVDCGAGILIHQKDLLTQGELLKTLFQDPARLKQMAESFQDDNPESAEIIADMVLKLKDKRTKSFIFKEYKPYVSKD